MIVTLIPIWSSYCVTYTHLATGTISTKTFDTKELALDYISELYPLTII